jgi:hypothetical protein
MLIRLLLADGEELAAGGIDELLEAMAPALRGYGVVLEVQAGEVPEDYIAQINGRRCRVWGGPQLPQCAGGSPAAAD